jgi:hypothetical protein
MSDMKVPFIQLREERGSIPIAMVLVTFVLATTVALGSLFAWQISNSRGEQLDTFAGWANESALSIAINNVAISGPSLSGIPTSEPSSWISDSSGEYYWRYWVIEHIRGDSPIVAVIAEIQLSNAVPEGQLPSTTSYRLTEYLRFDSFSYSWKSLYSAQPKASH